MSPLPSITIEDETPDDAAAIGAVTSAAFAGQPHSANTEAGIVTALRAAGALTVSLVARLGGEIVGHIGFSPVLIAGRFRDWYGLDPLSVRPDLQRRKIGTALVHEGLGRLRALDARGCVLVGDPAYYARFGFMRDPRLVLPEMDPAYVQILPFAADVPTGEVAFHDGFSARS